MSVIHSFLPMGMGEGPPHCTYNFNSQLPMGGGWYPPHFTSSQSHHLGGQWVGSSTFHIQTKSHQWRVGILHISHPKSHYLGGVWVGAFLHISHPVKLTLWLVGGCLVSSTLHTQSKSHCLGVGRILHISPTKLSAHQQ